MPIQMQKTSDRSFALTIEDRFDPSEDYTVEVIDMDTYSGVSKMDGKPFTSLKWIYRVYDADGVAFVDQVSGAPWEGVAFSSMALGGQAKARMYASGFLGHELTDAECDAIADNFDGALVGKKARVSFKVVEKKGEGGTVLGSNLEWALVRPILNRAPRSSSVRPGPSPAPVPPTPAAAGPGPMPSNGPPAAATGRETPAQRRARLEAELAAMDNDQVQEDGADDDPPF